MFPCEFDRRQSRNNINLKCTIKIAICCDSHLMNELKGQTCYPEIKKNNSSGFIRYDSVDGGTILVFALETYTSPADHLKKVHRNESRIKQLKNQSVC